MGQGWLSGDLVAPTTLEEAELRELLDLHHDEALYLRRGDLQVNSLMQLIQLRWNH